MTKFRRKMGVTIFALTALVTGAHASACAFQGQACSATIPCCFPETFQCNGGTCGGPGLKGLAEILANQEIFNSERSTGRDPHAEISVCRN